jgi:hemerythrin
MLRNGQNVPEKIERIVWDSKYSVGVEGVDAQHRQRFAIMNRTADIYESGSQELLPVLQDLVQYVSEHFHAEDMLMMKARYFALQDHRKEHDQFVDKLQEFLADYRRQDDQLTYRMLTYIRDWLLSHTQQVDMKYADFLKRSGMLKKPGT